MVRIQFDFDEFYPLHITIEEASAELAVERVHEVLGELMYCEHCETGGAPSGGQPPSN